VVNEQAAKLHDASTTRVLAVIVIYKICPSESPSLKTLLTAAAQIRGSSLELGILVQDNTPGGQDPGFLPGQVRYEAAPHNPGLAHAYNRALEIAETEGYDWLLTLDQDTALPADFLTRIEEVARRFQPSQAIAAIVPQVVGDGRILSPFWFKGGILPSWFRTGFVGSPSQAIYAVNSASTLSVAALKLLGGYDPLFPLDVSDINLFHKLRGAGKKVFVAGDIVVHHELALLDKGERMSIDRYRSGLMDECAFWDLNMGPLARLERMVRLVGMACKGFLKSDQHAFRRATISELKRRLGTSRTRRIAEWRNLTSARSAFSPVTSGGSSRPRTDDVLINDHR